jgi:hypothetical protein
MWWSLVSANAEEEELYYDWSAAANKCFIWLINTRKSLTSYYRRSEWSATNRTSGFLSKKSINYSRIVSGLFGIAYDVDKKQQIFCHMAGLHEFQDNSSVLKWVVTLRIIPAPDT